MNININKQFTETGDKSLARKLVQHRLTSVIRGRRNKPKTGLKRYNLQ